MPERRAEPRDTDTGWERGRAVADCACGRAAYVFLEPGVRLCVPCAHLLHNFRLVQR